jgi:hypothetical protein
VTVQTISPAEQNLFTIVATIIQLCQGRSNAVGTVSLVANAATTVVQAINCAPGTTVILTPTTAHAAAEIAAGGFYVSAVANGSFTITHASNAQIDRSFSWATYG